MRSIRLRRDDPDPLFSPGPPSYGVDNLLITRSSSDVFVERIPNARLAVMKDCRPGGGGRCPDRLLPAILVFLAYLRGPGVLDLVRAATASSPLVFVPLLAAITGLIPPPSTLCCSSG